MEQAGAKRSPSSASPCRPKLTRACRHLRLLHEEMRLALQAPGRAPELRHGCLQTSVATDSVALDVCSYGLSCVGRVCSCVGVLTYIGVTPLSRHSDTHYAQTAVADHDYRSVHRGTFVLAILKLLLPPIITTYYPLPHYHWTSASMSYKKRIEFKKYTTSITTTPTTTTTTTTTITRRSSGNTAILSSS